MIVVVMGVSGSGKSAVGRAVADALGWTFADGDDFHPQANVDKMHAGQPLTDVDRAPWLHAMHEAVIKWLAEGTNAVLACSALKHSYRDALRAPGVRFVYLDVARAVLAQRLQHRPDHFMPASLLASQLATLEVPSLDEAMRFDGAQPLPELVASIAQALR